MVVLFVREPTRLGAHGRRLQRLACRLSPALLWKGEVHRGLRQGELGERVMTEAVTNPDIFLYPVPLLPFLVLKVY